MKYYKVVNTQHIKLCSLQLEDMSKDLVVEYKENEWVSANIPGTKLFVYRRSDDDAEIFVKDFHLEVDYQQLWECEVENPIITERRLSILELEMDRVKAFWNGSLVDYVSCYWTVADRVKLIKRVR